MKLSRRTLAAALACGPLAALSPGSAWGDAVMGAFEAMVAKRIVTEEGIFPMEVAAKEFPNRKY